MPYTGKTPYEFVGNARESSVEGRDSRIICESALAVWKTRKGSPMSAKPIEWKRFAEFLQGAGRTDPEELRHAAQVSLWVRWFVMAFCLLEVNYRVEYGALSHVLNNFYILGLMAANGCVHNLVRHRGEAKPAWLMGLSVMDLAGISFSVSLSGGFDSPYFPLYYFAVAMFAWVFTTPRLALSWTTLVVAVYSTLSVLVEPGLDLDAKEERSLAYRVVALYAVSAAVSIITGFERDRRRKSLDRERELQRQRIEISQSIHDTTAQWAYMIGLGVEGALELADESNDRQKEKLWQTAELLRSAMWELRHPIDGGQIFRGEELGEVLEAHAATFTVITSVPAKFTQRGAEPPLSTISKSLLFSIAHNALTNVLRHAQASRVLIELDSTGELLKLSVWDDGIGLPPDYEDQGHGFRNMRADAERMDGILEVKSDKAGGGTAVICVVPRAVL